MGAAGAGKTTLAKKLIFPDYTLPRFEDSTHGIEVFSYDFKATHEESVETFTANIWDFGGQEIYHSTHKFFLSNRSLYILVADNRKEDTDFDYWLFTISLFAKNCPIIIVLNENNERKRDLNTAYYKKHFPSLSDVKKVNFLTEVGLSGMRETIEHQLSTLEHIGDIMPRKWASIRKKLATLNKNYILFDSFVDLCKEEGIIDGKQVGYISQYLHDLGVILHFQDDPLLGSIVILNPDWTTKAVYKILDSNIIIENNGKFTLSDLRNVWTKSDYKTSEHPYLIHLMLKFQLAYQIKNKNLYIAPQLLSVVKPNYQTIIAAELEGLGVTLEYNYSYSFMPKGILTKIIVLMHSKIWNNTVWRSGGVFRYNKKTVAEIEENLIERNIKIT